MKIIIDGKPIEYSLCDFISDEIDVNELTEIHIETIGYTNWEHVNVDDIIEISHIDGIIKKYYYCCECKDKNYIMVFPNGASSITIGAFLTDEFVPYDKKMCKVIK